LQSLPTANPAFGIFARPTHIYAIRSDVPQPLVKIGKADDPAARLRALATGLPYDLELLGTWCNDMSMERGFHHLLKDRRVRGEWFDLGADPMPYLQELADSPAMGRFMDAQGRARMQRLGRLLDKMEGQVTPAEFTWLAIFIVDGDGKYRAMRQSPAELAEASGDQVEAVVRVLSNLARKGWLHRVTGSNVDTAQYRLGEKFQIK